MLEQGDYEGGENDVYDYTSSVNELEYYDYESPYWKPSNEKMILLAQLRKLGIISILPKELR